MKYLTFAAGRVVAYWLVCALAVSCSKTPSEPTPQQRSSPENATAPKKPAQKTASSRETALGTQEAAKSAAFRHPAAKRVVAIGDLHGDFQATRAAFRLAGAVDTSDHWIGGELVVVQTGDQLDRGDDEREILQFLKRLASEAKSASGALLVLNGNHETMNVLGDFRYVTKGGLRDFDGTTPASPRAVNVPAHYEGRARAFLPGGGMALQLAGQPLIVMVGETAFVHGGILPSHVEYGIDRLNLETAQWMRGERTMPPPPVVEPDGPLWTRLYGNPTLSSDACAVLRTTLSALGAKRLVVGHTVQQKGMSGACDDRVFRIDVGLASYYGDHPVQVLELTAAGARILTAD